MKLKKKKNITSRSAATILKYKFWYRLLAYAGSVLILFTFLALPCSAIIDVSRGEGSNYDVTAKSSFPMDIGFTYRSSPSSTYNYTMMTSLGGFGQEWNRTSYGEDVVFYWYDELGNPVETERSLHYTYGDVEWTTEQGFIDHINGNVLGFQPINIGSDTPSSDQAVTTIVIRADDIVFNTAWLEWYNITRDSPNPPTLADLAYAGIPSISAPQVVDPATQRFIGRLNISYDISGASGVPMHQSYSISVDTQVNNSPIPLLDISRLSEWNIVGNPRLLIDNYYAWWDVDYYTKSVGSTSVVSGGIYVANDDFTLSPLERYNINFTSGGESFNYMYSTSSSIIYGKVDSFGTTSEVIAYDYEGWHLNYSTIELSYNYTVYTAFAEWWLSVFKPYLAPPSDVDPYQIEGCWRLRPDITDAELQSFVSSFGEQSFPVVNCVYMNVGVDNSSFTKINVYPLPYANFVLKAASDDENDWNNLQIGVYARGGNTQVYSSYGYGDYIGIDPGVFAVQISSGPPSFVLSKKYLNPISSSDMSFYNVARTLCFGDLTDSTLLNILQSFAFKWSDSVDDFTLDNIIKDDDELYSGPTVIYPDSSTIPSNPSYATWQVSYTDQKNYVDITVPLYNTAGAYLSNAAQQSAQRIYFSFPGAAEYAASLNKTSFDDLSWTDWLVSATSGFLDFNILPGLSFGGLIGILIAFSVVMIFLKVFAGG